MEDFRYKDYTDDESKSYSDAMNKIIAGLRNGMTFPDACDAVEVKNEELRRFVVDDALKVMIADLHYANGLSLEDVAESLKIPFYEVSKANDEMMEDVAIASAEGFRMIHPDEPVGNA